MQELGTPPADLQSAQGAERILSLSQPRVPRARHASPIPAGPLLVAPPSLTVFALIGLRSDDSSSCFLRHSSHALEA